MKALCLALLLSLAVGTSGQGFIAGCGHGKALDEPTYQKLISKLKSIQYPTPREQYFFNTYLPTQNVGFTGAQTAGIIATWTVDDSTKIKVFKHMKPWVLGLTAKDIVTIITTAQYDESRLTLLKGVVKMIYEPELRMHNETIIQAFQYQEDRNKAQTYLQGVTPVSCVFGDITEFTHAYFIIDVSGSMTDHFPIDGKITHRIDYAKEQLAVALSGLLSTQKFNIVKFSSSVHKWQSSLVDANPSNIASATGWTSQLKAGGSTNLYSALKAVWLDTACDGIYLLSDGQPNGHISTILSEAKSWGFPINTILLDAGDHPYKNDPGAAAFMQKLAVDTLGVYRNINK